MQALSVRELNEVIQEVIAQTFTQEIWVVGEINGLKTHAKSGHCYFDLIEKSGHSPGQYDAKVGCAFFRGAHSAWQTALRREGLGALSLADGLEVKLRARVDLYVKEGRYQLIVSEIDPVYSLGALVKKRRQTIEQLMREGLLERNKQLPFPECPLRLGLITSRGSAAYNDFCSIVLKSGFAFELTLYDAHMQGAQTSADVVAGLKALARRAELEAIVIIRGGGSRSDLSYFDDIAICRAIAQCPLPVITGIGHEIDLSVADMVAHRHFVTPTDVARFITGLLDDFWARVLEARQAVAALARSMVQGAHEHIRAQSTLLIHLGRNRILQARGSLERQAHALSLKASRQSLEQTALLRRIAARMQSVVQSRLAAEQEKLGRMEKNMEIIDPRNTLRRGYSITLDRQGRALVDVETIAQGELVETLLRHGRFESRVENKEQA